MPYTLTVGSASNGNDVSLPDNTVVRRSAPVTVSYLTEDMIAAINSNYLSCLPAIASTSSRLNITTPDTPPNISAGVMPFAAVSSLPTAATAIAGLAVVVNRLSNDLMLAQQQITKLMKKTGVS